MKPLLRNIDRCLLFRRGRIWHARIVIHGTLHRRSTFCRRKRDARPVAGAWRLQLLRRGKPTRATCVADTISG